MRSLTEHRAAALALASPLPAVEVLLDDADGLVVADDLRTDEPLPRWDNSAMDGYGVRHADVVELPATLRVVADLPAGTADEPVVGPGTAARIMTGAPVPAGADTIVPVELTDAGTATVRVREAPAAGVHIRRAGEDAVPGDVVVAAGTLLGPAAIAAVASLGRATVRVHRRPRVGVVSTGDELVAPGTPLRRGQLPDSNSWLLASAVRDAGGTPVRIGPVPDDVDALRSVLADLDGSVDAIITSGGVSVGAYDVVKAALADEPGVEFLPVAVQPGKPQGLGRLPGGTPIYTLPGNPVSSFASFEMFVRPALLRMRGLAEVERPTVQAVADEGWTTPPGRAQLMPVRWVGPDRVVRATARGSGSHLVARLALAEGLAVIPAEIDAVVAGDRVTVLKVSP
ncbi:gephyrin-like molybdotransferase Glp [Cellulomonas sp. Root137]|uniref:molybdopterin molybdotransferase MoeA n=1 Tax=Cellulomonas sp. Root137 TaxID=1736459 RepID=UPI0006F3BA7B|nr:gephyrin-like molybdotransferase Glp [Cellulomonas sp. Root137]KQY46309.1 molybdopterin molybdenumtransferase [Cellulomonas sp. Root137]